MSSLQTSDGKVLHFHTKGQQNFRLWDHDIENSNVYVYGQIENSFLNFCFVCFHLTHEIAAEWGEDDT